MNLLAALKRFWWQDTPEVMQAKMLREIRPRRVMFRVRSVQGGSEVTYFTRVPPRTFVVPRSSDVLQGVEEYINNTDIVADILRRTP